MIRSRVVESSYYPVNPIGLTGGVTGKRDLATPFAGDALGWRSRSALRRPWNPSVRFYVGGVLPYRRCRCCLGRGRAKSTAALGLRLLLVEPGGDGGAAESTPPFPPSFQKLGAKLHEGIQAVRVSHGVRKRRVARFSPHGIVVVNLYCLRPIARSGSLISLSPVTIYSSWLFVCLAAAPATSLWLISGRSTITVAPSGQHGHLRQLGRRVCEKTLVAAFRSNRRAVRTAAVAPAVIAVVAVAGVDIPWCGQDRRSQRLRCRGR